MEQKNIRHIVLGATAVLLIPFFGNIYGSGWNWTPGDFLFAWIFFIVLGFTYTFVTSKIVSRTRRAAAGLVVVAAFTFVWAMLATG